MDLIFRRNAERCEKFRHILLDLRRVFLLPYFLKLDERAEVTGENEIMSLWDALVLLQWYPRKWEIGTPEEFAKWIYAVGSPLKAGGVNIVPFDIAGAFNIYAKR